MKCLDEFDKKDAELRIKNNQDDSQIDGSLNSARNIS